MPVSERDDHAVRCERFQAGQAFATALAGGKEPALARDRAQLLTATTFGVWLAARIDPGSAARTCDSAVACVRAWRADPAEVCDAR